ncbi:hypothetical protein BRC89_11230 [Halobacteriales archaeon QS_4_70_19]|nr:MAG: hypothetical protein BRC89_11230 [Halobacteriales archaeon QS_4_70_19]
MDGRTAVGGLLAVSGSVFAFVAARALVRGLTDAGTPSLVALGGLTTIALVIAGLGVSLLARGRREPPADGVDR